MIKQNQSNNKTATMPNGQRRQRNTRAANRQRTIQRASDVRAESVQEPVVVQAEAVSDVCAMRELQEKYDKLKYKYNQAVHGNLLSFQEVEIQDLEAENKKLKEKNQVLEIENIIRDVDSDGREICIDGKKYIIFRDD